MTFVHHECRANIASKLVDIFDKKIVVEIGNGPGRNHDGFMVILPTYVKSGTGRAPAKAFDSGCNVTIITWKNG